MQKQTNKSVTYAYMLVATYVATFNNESESILL